MIIKLASYLSGIVILLSFLPYARDIFLGKTKPERISWLIWFVLGSIAFSSQFAEGASYSLVMTAAQAVGDFFIFTLAIKYGVGGFLKRDIAALIGAGVSLILWYLTKEAAVALLLVILIDSIGVVLTIIKTYEKPQTETVSAWVLTFLGGFFGYLAVGSFNPVLLLFPFYISLASFSILMTIKLGFRRISLK